MVLWRNWMAHSATNGEVQSSSLCGTTNFQNELEHEFRELVIVVVFRTGCRGVRFISLDLESRAREFESHHPDG